MLMYVSVNRPGDVTVALSFSKQVNIHNKKERMNYENTRELKNSVYVILQYTHGKCQLILLNSANQWQHLSPTGYANKWLSEGLFCRFIFTLL